MLHHKFYQNQLIQKNGPDKKSGLFLCAIYNKASETSAVKYKMQERLQQRSGILRTLMQFWKVQTTLSICYWYVSAGNGFTPPDSYQGGKMNSSKIQPRFEQ